MHSNNPGVMLGTCRSMSGGRSWMRGRCDDRWWLLVPPWLGFQRAG